MDRLTGGWAHGYKGIFDREVLGSPGRVTIKWLVPAWGTVYVQVGHLSI